ncbi:MULTISPECIES: triose-phosphate isomerase [Limnochorda]|uniref:triose-phosphate isomerase n=1 Tax=Limnochorda TaxID=1676651 RepID=UPI0017F54DB0|nr:triose-phosphate isomerase [Limnochorda pilosa]MBO2486147.1 triose-phosphate isomerase [Bacillota bacterium]MBO2518327.1 triose-phosphate isomerase [Bacillota bacterium]NMA70953.1 triose-phosphate isomerase [Bacillota bacterium]
MRRPLMAGNWKMHLTLDQAEALARGVASGLAAQAVSDQVEVVVCPPFVHLERVSRALAGSPVALGAQDLFWEDEGAYTGEVSGPQLVDLGCRYVIVGHSERRHVLGESNEAVRRKLEAALRHGVRPILCVGERIEERRAGRADATVANQVRTALAGLTPEQARQVVIAYEPVWAIGTGEHASGEEANRMAGLIRDQVGELFTAEVAEAVRILYGGSVKPANVAEFVSQPQVDGALVGGASLEAEGFVAMAAAAGGRQGGGEA